jgi:hypothetical protein
MKVPKPFSNAFHRAILALCACSIAMFCYAQTSSDALPSAATPATLAAVAPVTDCAKLGDADVSAAVGAKVHMTSATPVTDGKPAAYCRVTGYVEPMVKFEVRLPMSGWTQRFVQTGCGGLCGNLSIRVNNASGCYPADHGELALASTDVGHTGGMDGKFGEKEYQLRIDFAYRGVHVTTLAAKALIDAFYGQPAKYSYFTGCSDGGREALMEAQRYPQDFNGITAGAPAMNFTTQNTFYHGWNALKNTDADGRPILTADKLPILHQVALNACDAADGLEDGLISDPLSCLVDSGVAECKPQQDEKTCLTHAQVQTARDIYAGAHDGDSDKFVLSGPMPGSELAWQGVYVPNPGDDRTMSATISTGTLKYLAYQENPADSYTLADLKFSRDSFTAATKLHGLYDSTDPDLSSFAKAGGKLIIWHGLADPHISPLNSIAYYSAMNRVMGDAEVQKFTRLYLFPGGYHCNGGEGPFNFDALSAIMAWVERGTAPFAIDASHQIGGPAGPPLGARGGGGRGTGPTPGNAPPSGQALMSKVDRTRPVYPYPLTAKYNGSGSIDDATNFSPGPAKSAPASRLQWMGASFYTPHYELWCVGDGAAMTCKSNP